MRPQYESQASIDDEMRVAREVQRTTGLYLRRLPPRYPADFVIEHNEELRAFCEVKVRDCASKDFPAYMLSLAKWAALQRLSEFAGARAILIVRWTDRTAWATVPDHGLKVVIGGRVDRDDWQDVEPVALIPMDLFHPLDKLKGAITAT
jgi:hypothetical protein